MSFHQPNGSTGWPAAQSNGKPGGLLDLSKGGLGIGMVATIAWGLFVAGQTWGTYQERGTVMQSQLSELKADVKAIKEALPEIRVALKEIVGRPDPRWTMHVEGKR